MLNLIKEIIEQTGPRRAGTDAETKAQHLLLAKCAEHTDKTEFLPFSEYLDARFGKLKYYAAIFFVCMALYLILPIAAAILSAANALILILDMGMYRDVLTSIPGKKQTSSNATATLEPQGAVRSTLIFSAHIDSTPEFTWWYRYGHAGVVLTVLGMVLIVLQAVFLTIHALHSTPYDLYVWIAFILLSPLTIVIWSMLGKEVVQGAADNLSGIAIAFEVFKTLADKHEKGRSVLRNTRLRFVSFGSEERGLCGSRAYAALRKSQLLSENAHLLNIDNVRLATEFTIMGRELLSGTIHSPVLIKGLQDSFKALDIPYKMGMVPIGGSDAISLARVGIPSVTVIGMNSKRHDFTYHTRHDIPENIEPQALEKLRDVLLDFVKRWDVR
jgi:hypothetical protein